MINWIIANSLVYNEEREVYERGGFISFRADMVAAYKPHGFSNGKGTRILLSCGDYIEVWGSMQQVQSTLLKVYKDEMSEIKLDE